MADIRIYWSRYSNSIVVVLSEEKGRRNLPHHDHDRLRHRLNGPGLSQVVDDALDFGQQLSPPLAKAANQPGRLRLVEIDDDDLRLATFLLLPGLPGFWSCPLPWLPCSISIIFVIIIKSHFRHPKGCRLAHLLKSLPTRPHEVTRSIVDPGLATFLDRVEVALIGILSRDDLRLQHMSDAFFDPLKIWTGHIEIFIFIFIFVALIDDVCMPVFTAALNDDDTLDEFVHDVHPNVGVNLARTVGYAHRPDRHPHAPVTSRWRSLVLQVNLTSAATGSATDHFGRLSEMI